MPRGFRRFLLDFNLDCWLTNSKSYYSINVYSLYTIHDSFEVLQLETDAVTSDSCNLKPVCTLSTQYSCTTLATEMICSSIAVLVGTVPGPVPAAVPVGGSGPGACKQWPKRNGHMCHLDRPHTSGRVKRAPSTFWATPRARASNSGPARSHGARRQILWNVASSATRI